MGSSVSHMCRAPVVRISLVKNRSSPRNFIPMLPPTERFRRLIVPRVLQPFFALALAFEDCLLLYFARIFERRLEP